MSSINYFSAKTIMIYSLPQYGLLSVSGNDAKKLLQGQLTCDLDAITAKNSSLGAHCLPQGRVISLFHLFQLKTTYYLLMPRSLIAIALQALKKYAVFYRVELADVSNVFSILGYDHKLPFLSDSPIDLPLISIPVDAERSYAVLTSDAHENMSAHFAAEQEWQRRQIQARLPTIYPETSGKFLPHDLNLQNLQGISFDKGCYTGQEIIARMHYRGKLKNNLYQVAMHSTYTPQRGGDVYTLVRSAMQSCGMIVDVAETKTINHYSALIVAEDTQIKNNELFVDSKGEFPLTVAREC